MTVKRLLAASLVSALTLAGAAAAFQYPTAGQQGPGAPVPALPGQTPMGAYTIFNPENSSYNLAKEYANTEGDEKRRELRRKLEEALTKEFDQQSERQEKELKALEVQIRSLRSLLQKRKDAKADIIDRRIDELVQNAQGLGWNPSGTRPGYYMGGFSTTPVPAAQAPLAPRTTETPKPRTSRP